jgi:hypothetical protein
VDLRIDPVVQAAMMGQTFLPPTTPTPDGPGYPVLVDPIGVLAYTGQVYWPQWVGGTLNSIPRVCGTWGPFAPAPLGSGGVPTVAGCLKWCSIQDDLNFSSDIDPASGSNYLGLAANPPAFPPVNGLGTVQRNLRYSFAWMMRMPRAASPSVVDVSVLVFSGRSLDLVGFDTQEKAYTAVFNAPANTISLYQPAGATEPPSLRRGQWVLDASVSTVTGTLSARGFFYRIVSVSDPILDPTNNTYYVTVEVQTPLRQWPDLASFPASQGTVVIFDNLVEVFDDGTF